MGTPRDVGPVGPEDFPGHGGRPGSAEPDDAQARLAGGRGNCGDGIGRIRLGHAGPAASSWPSFFLAGEMTTFL